jgi:MFS family permease
MFAGAILLLSCILVALAGQTFPYFVVGLVLLGVGWNFLYIGGTTLLTEVYTPAEKGSIQGINEFLVFTTTAFTALSSGYLHHRLGWEALNRYTLPVIFFAACIIAWLGWRANGRKPKNTGIKIPAS